MPTVGAAVCQCSAGTGRGSLAWQSPWEGNLQAELGLLAEIQPGAGMVVLGRQCGMAAAVGVVCWIHHRWISVTLSRNFFFMVS